MYIQLGILWPDRQLRDFSVGLFQINGTVLLFFVVYVTYDVIILFHCFVIESTLVPRPLFLITYFFHALFLLFIKYSR